MKVILESWKRFIKEQIDSDVVEHNAEYIVNFFLKAQKNRLIKDLLYSRFNIDLNNILNVKEQVKNMIVDADDRFPLKHQKVIKELGSGTFGVALLLPDDLVLKVYWGSFDPESRTVHGDNYLEKLKYDKIQQDLYDKKKGDINQPNIIEQGELKLGYGSIDWVLMSRFTETLMDLIRRIEDSIYDRNQQTNFINDIERLFIKINPDLIQKTPKRNIPATVVEPKVKKDYSPAAYSDTVTVPLKKKKINESTLSKDKIDLEINKIKQKYKKHGLDIKEMDRLKVIFKNILIKLPELKIKIGNLSDVRPPNIGLIGDNPIFFDY